MIFRNCHKMMYFYMYLQSVVPESCLSGTIVKYISYLFYLSDFFQTKTCCQTYILFCEFSCISHANNRFCSICLYSLLYPCCIPFRINFSDSSSRTSPPIVFSNPFFVFSKVPKTILFYQRKVFIEFITNVLLLLFSVPVPEMSVYHLQLLPKIGLLFSTDELPCPFELLP